MRYLAITIVCIIVSYLLVYWTVQYWKPSINDTLSVENWVVIDNLSPDSDITITSDRADLRLPLAIKLANQTQNNGFTLERITDSEYRGNSSDFSFTIHSPSGQKLSAVIQSSAEISGPVWIISWHGMYTEQDTDSLRGNSNPPSAQELQRRIDAGEIQVIEP